MSQLTAISDFEIAWHLGSVDKSCSGGYVSDMHVKHV